MPRRKISGSMRVSDHEFTDEQREQVKSLLETGREMEFTWDEETVLEAVFITATKDKAFECLLDPNVFEQQRVEFQQAELRGTQREGMRASRHRPSATPADASKKRKVIDDEQEEEEDDDELRPLVHRPVKRQPTGVASAATSAATKATGMEEEWTLPAATRRPPSPAAAVPLPPPSAQAGLLHSEHGKDYYEAKLKKHFAKLRKEWPDAALRWVESTVRDLTPSERQRICCLPVPPPSAEPTTTSSAAPVELLGRRAGDHGVREWKFGIDDDEAEAKIHRQAEGGESKRASSAASTFEVCFKLGSGSTIRVPVHNAMTIDEVKQALERKSNGDPACRADSVRLLFAGKELTRWFGDYGIGKEATVHVVLKKNAWASASAPEYCSVAPAPASESAAAPKEPSLISRPDPLGGRYFDFDARDGWATAENISVGSIQAWLVKREQGNGPWIHYGSNGNTLQYFLDKSHEYADAMAVHLQRWFGPGTPANGRSMEGFENPANWDPVPQCVHAAVEQMRQVLVDPTTQEPLLEEFVLAFAQFTRMPVCDINRANHPLELAPHSMSTGRGLGAHWDSPGYLEVIVTLGIFGEVDVQLVLPPASQIRSGVLPRERKEGITISAGRLYAIWGKSRWKMYHDAIVGRNERAVPGMRAETARVGCTLRFCRRSFARLCAARLAREHGAQYGANVRGAPPPPALVEVEVEAGRTIVDAYYYSIKGARVNEHSYPHTYPALVLEANAGSLLVLYISDGLIPDDDEEAWSFGLVPIEHAVLASDLVRRRCLGSGTKAASMTKRLLEDMETGKYTGGAWRGVAAFVEDLRKRGPDEMLNLLKASSIRC